MDREAVESFFIRHEIEFSWHAPTQTYYGMLRDLETTALTSSNLAITVQMSEEGYVEDVELRSVYTGP
jgi:hypothetical protein